MPDVTIEEARNDPGLIVRNGEPYRWGLTGKPYQSPFFSNVRDFWAGAGNSIANNATLGLVPREYRNSLAFQNGQTAGDVLSVVGAAAEMALGAFVAVGGGGGLAVSGVGTVAAPIAVSAGVGMMTHGAAVMGYMLNSEEHTTNKQKKNWDKHTKPRSGRSNTKNRKKPNWKQNPNK